MQPDLGLLHVLGMVGSKFLKSQIKGHKNKEPRAPQRLLQNVHNPPGSLFKMKILIQWVEVGPESLHF